MRAQILMDRVDAACRREAATGSKSPEQQQEQLRRVREVLDMALTIRLMRLNLQRLDR
jgi:hypothetical protein